MNIAAMNKQIDTSVALLHVAKAAYRAHAENTGAGAWEDLSTVQRVEWMAAMERVVDPEASRLKGVSAVAHATLLGYESGRAARDAITVEGTLDHEITVEGILERDDKELVTRESAEAAIDHVAQSNTAGRDDDARAMLASPEATYIEQAAHLNCPACGGSGHVEDAAMDWPTTAMLRKLVDNVWNHVTESTAVPETRVADEIIKASGFPLVYDHDTLQEAHQATKRAMSDLAETLRVVTHDRDASHAAHHDCTGQLRVALKERDAAREALAQLQSEREQHYHLPGDWKLRKVPHDHNAFSLTSPDGAEWIYRYADMPTHDQRHLIKFLMAMVTPQSGTPCVAADGKTTVFNIPGYPLLVRAVDFNALVGAKAGS